MDGYSVPDAEKQPLVDAWLRAHYRIEFGGTCWPLRIGARASAFEQAARAWRARSWLLITAWNPPCRQTSHADNRAADLCLQQTLEAADLRRLPASADDGHGGWREPGWLVADARVEQADRLARQFEQGGVLFWKTGDVVALRLAWSRPIDAPVRAHVIWTG